VPPDGMLRGTAGVKGYISEARNTGRQEVSKDGAKIAPSILAANFADLGTQVCEAERAGPIGSTST
jgi:hypothetical protein